jgi:hypothetical protein
MPTRTRTLGDVAFWCAAMLGAVLLALLGLALTGVAPVESEPSSPGRETTPQVPQRLQTTAPTVPALPPPEEPATTAPPVTVTVTVTAARGDSWVSARLGSETGRVLEERLLAHGETTRLAGPRVWLLVGAPENVEVLVDGEPRELARGTLETVFGPAG